MENLYTDTCKRPVLADYISKHIGLVLLWGMKLHGGRNKIAVHTQHSRDGLGQGVRVPDCTGTMTIKVQHYNTGNPTRCLFQAFIC